MGGPVKKRGSSILGQSADADHDRSGVDTLVESETVKDTTVVTADTSIDVDTVKKTDNIEDKKE